MLVIYKDIGGILKILNDRVLSQKIWRLLVWRLRLCLRGEA